MNWKLGITRLFWIVSIAWVLLVGGAGIVSATSDTPTHWVSYPLIILVPPALMMGMLKGFFWVMAGFRKHAKSLPLQ